MNNKVIYMPGLNGLRAIAAIAVVIAHTMVQLGRTGLTPLIIFPLAQYAVTLFFVISGFLITYLLLIEKQRTNIDIKKFYVRRILRIWPLYYLFILLCFLFPSSDTIFNNLRLTRACLYFIFIPNFAFIFGKGIDILGHYWSIGVEEQFYLFWPLIMRMACRKIVPIIILILVSFTVLKTGAYFILGKDSIVYLIFSMVRFSNMMIGALGAFVYYKNNVWLLTILTNKLLQLTAWSLFAYFGFFSTFVPSLFMHDLISILSLIIIFGQVYKGNKIINLENRFFTFLGTISYGMYIIHPLVIVFFSDRIKGLPIDVLQKCALIHVLVVVFTIALAYLSYNYFERPFLALKNKFTTVKSSNKEFALAS